VFDTPVPFANQFHATKVLVLELVLAAVLNVNPSESKEVTPSIVCSALVVLVCKALEVPLTISQFA
jgi:hypothetical protein